MMTATDIWEATERIARYSKRELRARLLDAQVELHRVSRSRDRLLYREADRFAVQTVAAFLLGVAIAAVAAMIAATVLGVFS